MLFKSLSDFATNTKKTINTATYRSLNKTYSKINTKFKKEIRTSTGLPLKFLNKRFKVKKASKTNFSGYVSMGTKFGISLDNFKPKVKIIKKSKRKYQGVTVKIGKGAREIVQGGFIATVKSGKSLILVRKGKERSPTYNPKHNLHPIAKQIQPSLKSYGQSEYKLQFQQQIKYELSKGRSDG